MSTMTLASLVAELKATLHDSAAVFKAADDADFVRFLQRALPDMQFKRPVTRQATVLLVPGVARYAMPVADFAAMKTHQWGEPSKTPKPWEESYPGAVPRVCASWDGSAHWVELDPPPTAKQIGVFGRELPFWYFALHTLGTTPETTSVNPQDRGLLLMRAQVEALKELTLRNLTKPVQLRDGLSGTPRNSTPAALHTELLRLFWETR